MTIKDSLLFTLSMLKTIKHQFYDWLQSTCSDNLFLCDPLSILQAKIFEKYEMQIIHLIKQINQVKVSRDVNVKVKGDMKVKEEENDLWMKQRLDRIIQIIQKQDGQFKENKKEEGEIKMMIMNPELNYKAESLFLEQLIKLTSMQTEQNSNQVIKQLQHAHSTTRPSCHYKSFQTQTQSTQNQWFDYQTQTQTETHENDDQKQQQLNMNLQRISKLQQQLAQRQFSLLIKQKSMNKKMQQISREYESTKRQLQSKKQQLRQKQHQIQSQVYQRIKRIQKENLLKQKSSRYQLYQQKIQFQYLKREVLIGKERGDYEIMLEKENILVNNNIDKEVMSLRRRSRSKGNIDNDRRRLIEKGYEQSTLPEQEEK